ncbi:phosphomannomutase/phosphoglucomutase [Candidatus Bathyarchaeota archaeon]|nr:MAG: phosphomannomutase/phosphoglucomutase [Candidatus Bathyarchaeota archaeon]
MKISERIFRAYDIRGVYGKEINEEIAEEIGKAFGTYIGAGKNLIVGRDARPTGERLQSATIAGLISTGCHVLDVGIVPTPVFYFAIVHYEKDGGVMITASHNPSEWNGFKLCRENGILCSEGMGMEEIKAIALSRDFRSIPHGRVERYDKTLEDYANFVLNKIEIKRTLKVAVDLLNSPCSLIVPSLFRKAGMDVIAINAELNGTFPHGLEPTEEILEDLKRTVTRYGADFGVGFDGDGDRTVFVDDKGRVIPSDITLAIMARHYLENRKGAVVYDVCCSTVVEEIVKKMGGKPVVSRVGRAYVMDLMKREGAVLGGEVSGHLYFSDMYGFDDAIYAGLKMGEILSKTDMKLSQILDSLPNYPSTPVKKYKCPDEKKFDVVNQLTEEFKEMGYKTITIDGVKVINSDGWLIIRASNTLPQIKMKAEAKNKKKLEQLVNIAEKKLASKGIKK